MKTNVKPGDRAIIVQTTHPECNSNIGRVVQVVSEIRPGETHPAFGRSLTDFGHQGPFWVVESLSGPLASIAFLPLGGAIVAKTVKIHSASVYRDAHLRRLPDPDEVREHDAQDQHVPASDYWQRQREGADAGT